MKASQILLVLIISIVAATATVYGLGKNSDEGSTAPMRESAYERVLRTGVLRCGYADWPPYIFVKDPNTKQLSGISVEVINTVAERLGIKVEWSEEVGWGSAIESLRSNRTDAFCVGIGRTAERGRYLGYTIPTFYLAMYPYVRSEDHRFDHDVSLINNPNIRVSVMDGEISDIIAKKHFPKAKSIAVPQLGQITDIFMNVATGKADVVFQEPTLAEGFNKANPGKLRQAQEKPFQAIQISIAVSLPETQLRDMLDSTLSELHNQGVIEQIISKYNNDPKMFLRVAQPYK